MPLEQLLLEPALTWKSQGETGSPWRHGGRQWHHGDCKENITRYSPGRGEKARRKGGLKKEIRMQQQVNSKEDRHSNVPSRR